MNAYQINTALISDDPERLLNLNLYISTPHRKIFNYDFKTAFDNILKSEVFDLVIIDLSSNPGFDFKSVVSIRREKLHQTTPILFILNTEQANYRMEIYKEENSSFLIEPTEKFELLNAVKMLENLGQLKKRIHIYSDVLESEKQLVNHLDPLLQIKSFSMFDNLSQAFFDIQNNFVHKMELTFAVEKVVYLYYLPKESSLQLNLFKDSDRKLKQKVIFIISNSVLLNSIKNDTPIVLEGQKLLDPFIQELEETIGFKINSLLFHPLSLFHVTHGGFAIINKIYRHNFSENDISLTLLTSQKIKYQLESLHLKKMGLSNFSDLLHDKKSKVLPEKIYDIYKNILESISFGLIVFDEKFQIKFMNKFTRELLNIDSENNISMSEVFGDEAFSAIKKSIGEQVLPALRQEVLIARMGAQNLDLGYSIYPINIGKHQQFALTFMEISQSRHIQSEIIRMDRMASLGILASGIAHEIRNPLAGIKAMAQTLEEELEGEPTKIEYSQRIVRQVNRLDKLLKSFFSYAKPQRPNPVECKIPDIVKEVLPLFERSIKEKNIKVKQVYSPNLKTIFVDSHQIQQVFFNLIINALHALKNGGLLTIKARLPEETNPIIDRRQRRPKLFSDIYDEIKISDTGNGMDSSTLKNMYNPFFTTKPTGTGLGLSIVYQIIREHGGQISVDSDLDTGTTFKIYLPVYIDKREKDGDFLL